MRTMTSLIAAGGSVRSVSVIPAPPADSSVTTIAFIRSLPSSVLDCATCASLLGVLPQDADVVNFPGHAWRLSRPARRTAPSPGGSAVQLDGFSHRLPRTARGALLLARH